MKKHNYSILGVIGLTLTMAIGVFTSLSTKQVNETFGYDIVDPSDYYSSSLDSLSGDALLDALRDLNSANRKSTVGYGSLPNKYIYTDYDPAYATTDSSGITSGTRLLGFYSGTSSVYSGAMNREHVWPNTHGGSAVEGDIHMTRPTIIAENGSRGHSFYIEGMKHSQNGWDPAMESFGDETYRGDSARIIFYSMVATKTLTLTDDKSRSSNTNNHEMGVISDMLSWNLRYPVTQREQNRNKGAQYLQGNRNPFIDHPEYACKIWGEFNANTKEICSVAAPETITLNTTSVDVIVGDTYQLSVASVTPSDASKSVTWSSDNTSIATIDSTGLVTTHMPGDVEIYATSTLNTSIKATATIHVKEPSDVALQSVSLSLSTTNISVGDKVKANVVLNPTNTYPKPTYAFSSSDSNVASVSNSGEVTGLAEGQTTISVTATQSSTSVVKNSSVVVNVTKANQYKKVTSSDDLVEGQYLIVNETASKMLNPNASTLDSQGNASAVTISSNTINQTDDTAQNEFSVLKSGNGYTFMTATGKYLTNSSKAVALSDSAVVLSATPNEVSNGNNSLKYNSQWGGFRFYTSGQSPISLYKKSGSDTPVGPVSVNGVAISQSSATLSEGEELTLTATVSPVNATNKNVSWSSSDDSVASVVNGLVTALKEGAATITVTTEDGGFSATCEVTVTKATEVVHVSSVSLNKTSLSLNVNEEYTLVATIAPSNATNKNVTWSTSDSNVASVTNGKIKALKAGSATITVTTVDGSFTATCRVEVKGDAPTPGPNNDNNTTGIIIGSVAGGTVALGGVVALIVFLVIKNKSRKLIK